MSEQFCLEKFQHSQTLSTNITQKRSVFLGGCEGQEGQAIVIVNAKVPKNTEKYAQINKVFHNDIYSRYDVKMEGEYEIQAIFPITQKHKKKYEAKHMIMIKQTAEEYEKGKEKLLEHQLKHIGWVLNIIEGKAEAQRVLHRDPQFVILPDFKYSNLQEKQNLHLLVIFTDNNLHSLRSLRGEHISLLQQVESKVTQILQSRFDLQGGSCRMFLHYPPTFYRLHIHVTNLRSHAGNALIERAHLLENVISNLKIDGQYYGKVGLMKTVQK